MITTRKKRNTKGYPVSKAMGVKDRIILLLEEWLNLLRRVDRLETQQLDSTRIHDAADTTYLDTDEVTNEITGNANTARITVSEEAFIGDFGTQTGGNNGTSYLRINSNGSSPFSRLQVNVPSYGSIAQVYSDNGTNGGFQFMVNGQELFRASDGAGGKIVRIGDIDADGNVTELTVNDNFQSMTYEGNNVLLGDTLGNRNGNLIELYNSTNEMNLNSGTIRIGVNGATNTVLRMGNFNNSTIELNGVDITLNTSNRFTINTVGNLLTMTELPEYVDNAAAIGGGLNIDDVYKTPTGELRIVVA